MVVADGLVIAAEFFFPIQGLFPSYHLSTEFSISLFQVENKAGA